MFVLKWRLFVFKIFIFKSCCSLRLVQYKLELLYTLNIIAAILLTFIWAVFDMNENVFLWNFTKSLGRYAFVCGKRKTISRDYSKFVFGISLIFKMKKASIDWTSSGLIVCIRVIASETPGHVYTNFAVYDGFPVVFCFIVGTCPFC